MAEYYGYAERDANAYVDWGKLGENLTETVQAAYKIRAERKQKLDKVMQQNYNELVNAPSGLNQDINKTITNHVGNTKEFLLRANKLLKAGVLKPEDYTLIMQNQKEDNKAIFDNAKNWQTAWAKIQDDVASGKGSKAMLDLASDVASFGKFNNMDFMINPVTGRVNASKMIINKNGERIKGESMTMQQLNVLMNQNIDKYKLTDKLVALQGQMGENTISKFREARIQKNGQIGEIADKRIRADYDITKKTFIDEITANPINTLSILMDYKNTIPSDNDINAMLNAKPPLITAAEANEMRSMAGKAYRTSTNPNDFGKADVIYYEDKEGDGSRVARLTTAQEKVVNKFASDQFDGLIDHKESNQAISAISPSYTPEYMLNRGDKETEKDNAVGAWDKLRSGTAKEKQDAANILLGTTRAQELGLIDIDLTAKPGFALLKYTDGGKDREIEIGEDGANWSAIGVELHGQNDVNKARKAAGDSWGKPRIADYEGVRAQRRGDDYSQEMSSYTNENVSSSVVEDSGAKTASNLNEKFKNLGFTIKGDYNVGLTGASDYIIITAPDGKTKSEKIYVDDTENVSEIEAFLNANLDNAKAANVFKRQAGGQSTNTGGASNSGGKPR